MAVGYVFYVIKILKQNFKLKKQNLNVLK